MNVQNMLLMFHMHSLVCSWIVQLALGTALMLEYLCDNIGLVLVYLPSGSTDVTTSPSRYITQPSGIPILSPVLLCMLVIPIFPFLKIRRIFDLLVYSVGCRDDTMTKTVDTRRYC